MTNNPRYTLGTEANRIFMASETYELLKFGKGFPAPDGGSGWLNADGTLDPSHGVETTSMAAGIRRCSRTAPMLRARSAMRMPS